MPVSDLDYLAAHLKVDRRDIDVLADWLRADGCAEVDVPVQIREILDPGWERTLPEWYTGAAIEDDDERFTVRRQPPGWSAH